MYTFVLIISLSPFKLCFSFKYNSIDLKLKQVIALKFNQFTEILNLSNVVSHLNTAKDYSK